MSRVPPHPKLEGLQVMTGFDDCILGVCSRFGQEEVVAYDKEKVLAKLAQDMSYEDAVEYFEFNQLGAYVGEDTPCFVETI